MCRPSAFIVRLFERGQRVNQTREEMTSPGAAQGDPRKHFSVIGPECRLTELNGN